MLSTSVHRSLNIVSLSLLASLPLTAGCGDNRFPVSPAKGKVVCQGQPVTVGSVSFVPIGEPGQLETGKAATATLGSDGTFVLTTFNRFDGAIVGKHRVQYNVPEEDGSNESDESKADPDAPGQAARAAEKKRQLQAQRTLQCVQKGELILEVQSRGENDFTIELTPAGK
jgi:hypothetical protein